MASIQWRPEVNALTVPQSYKLRCVPRDSMGTDGIVAAMTAENPNYSVEAARYLYWLIDRLYLGRISSAIRSSYFYHVLIRILLIILFVLSASWCHAYEDLPVPEGYVLQHLDPTDGRIAKPKDWYYTSRGTPSGWLWTLSKEDPSKGAYKTGLRIQLLLGIKHVTKRSTKEFAQDFLEQKRKTTKVVCEHEPVDQGDFVRQCLEVVETINLPEGPVVFHIIYSVFWGKEMDMVGITTFGTPEKKWEDYISVSKVMATFDVIGPNFGKDK